MSAETAWDDPTVKAALKQGRRPADISLLCCEGCGVYGYYNDGSHFTCRSCGWGLSWEDLDELLNDGGVITLEDYAEMLAEEEPMP